MISPEKPIDVIEEEYNANTKTNMHPIKIGSECFPIGSVSLEKKKISIYEDGFKVTEYTMYTRKQL